MNQIILKDHGILPGSECTLELAELFRKYPTDTEFVFEAGDSVAFKIQVNSNSSNTTETYSARANYIMLKADIVDNLIKIVE